MKTNRSMTRTLGLLALSLFAALTATEAQADSMLPRYRLEDLGPAEEFLGWSPILFPDGTVDKYTNPTNKEYWRRGDYKFSTVEIGGGHISGYTLYKDGSDVNLLAGFNSSINYVQKINAVGQVLAEDLGNRDGLGPYIYDSATGTKTYVNLSGIDGAQQTVYGLNSSGNLVGYATMSGGLLGATFYQSATTEAILLDTLIDGASNWHLSTAGDINDAGEIVGIGSDLNKPTPGGRAYKLVPITPVPEPSTWLIFAACGIWAGRTKIGSSLSGMKTRIF
ncbi:hypothetical protein GC170_20165 [bacterium]|nr:hypothetical protein [bacterium]